MHAQVFQTLTKVNFMIPNYYIRMVHWSFLESIIMKPETDIKDEHVKWLWVSTFLKAIKLASAKKKVPPDLT